MKSSPSISVSNYWISLLCCLILALHVAADAREASTLDTKNLMRELEQAKFYAQRAQALPVHDGNCQGDLSRALSNIEDAEQQVTSQDWETVAKSLEAAADANSDCRNALQSDSAPLARALSYLMSQISKHLVAVQTALQASSTPKSGGGMATESFPGSSIDGVYKPNDVGGGSAQGCPKTSVDGTLCPYSACGQGFGLVSCSIGFAQGVVGGLNGQTYTVTSNQDSPTNPAPGTLRYAVNLARGTAGVWIKFSSNMIISLQDMLWVQSHTTIDGRGVNVTINNRNLVLGGVKDVIIHNIQVNKMDGSDTIHIFSGTSKVWIDHVTSFDGHLGLASVLQGSTDVTISNCRLQNYNFNMLLGASDADIEDKIMRVTVYRNWFRDSMQRMPHCRWGICHVVNNLYTNWGYYAIGARVNARVRSESNVFIASRAREVTPWFEGTPESFDMSARIESKNDLLLNGSTFHQFTVATQDATPPYTSPSSYPPIISTSALPSLVQQCAGAQFGANLMKCQNAL